VKKRKDCHKTVARARQGLPLDMHFPSWDRGILSRFDASQIVDNVAGAHVDLLIFPGKFSSPRSGSSS